MALTLPCSPPPAHTLLIVILPLATWHPAACCPRCTLPAPAAGTRTESRQRRRSWLVGLIIIGLAGWLDRAMIVACLHAVALAMQGSIISAPLTMHGSSIVSSAPLRSAAPRCLLLYGRALGRGRGIATTRGEGHRVWARNAEGQIIAATIVESDDKVGRLRVRFDRWSGCFTQWINENAVLRSLGPAHRTPLDNAALQIATAALGAQDKLSLSQHKKGGSKLRMHPGKSEARLEALRDAVRVVSEQSHQLMLGVLGDDPNQAVDALRTWQQALALPQPPLCVLDETSTDGVCAAPGVSDEVALFGLPSTSRRQPAYIKYNAMGGANLLKPHEGT